MMLLEVANVILEESILRLLNAPKPESADIAFADFDGVQFHVSTDPNDKQSVTVSIAWPCMGELQRLGAMDDYRRIYGDMVCSSPEPNFNFSIKFHTGSAPSDEAGRAALAKKISLMKRHAIAAPFLRTFAQITAGNAGSQVIKIPYRPNESIYIKPEKESCIVIFSVHFVDDADKVLAKVFLQEFQDARRTISGAPSVTYSQKEPPMEMQQIGIRDADDNVGWVSFVLFDKHIGERNMHLTADMLSLFRDYLHYHIKCSKAYMHERMRNRVVLLLQVLNRARPEPFEKKEKKTASGRTFQRAGAAPPAGRGRGGGFRGRGH
eukprot:CAMPEP_0177645338 /NCGR_PEP_ID=MMETSP0447-20121125/9195_1 /TAXON_ID=0 /ORGANISM="Stygamoeba regulata, Strain BSH-02190019" /LENGTH=321 /DNA_ID=CAMNT_0019147813 /DNA_START=107 /DNA_END=1072 /DNA_ORIENTATION=+